jgi:hypothetical protein
VGRRVEAEIQAGGKTEVNVPLPPGSRVEVLVRAEAPDDFRDLLESVASGLDFWDNPEDDAKWNAPCG